MLLLDLNLDHRQTKWCDPVWLQLQDVFCIKQFRWEKQMNSSVSVCEVITQFVTFLKSVLDCLRCSGTFYIHFQECEQVYTGVRGSLKTANIKNVMRNCLVLTEICQISLEMRRELSRQKFTREATGMFSVTSACEVNSVHRQNFWLSLAERWNVNVKVSEKHSVQPALKKNL